MMNRDRAKELLPIIQAFADGKQIQFNNGNGDWFDVEKLDCDWDADRFRIKPEPEVVYVNRSKGGTDRVFTSEDLAEAYVSDCNRFNYVFIGQKFIAADE